VRHEPAGEDDVWLLVSVLPVYLQEALRAVPLSELIEIVMDLGRPAEARLSGRALRLSERPVSRDDLAHVTAQLGAFTEDNRAGIERTLHRISALRNRQGEIIGLTLRVGRAVFGTIDILRDLLESGKNLLILGRPGVGKTTKLREAARVLADDFGKRVIVIDTSNEIAGDGDVPHPAIGGARRMQVPRVERQHAVMIEAVENHMPEVIIVDEIGTEAEAAAARTIAERGVQLIGTAHGNTLENLVMNPTLSDLVGGVHTVTLSDEEARRRGTAKTINERRAPPTFDIVVEMVSHDEVVVHRDTAEAVDRLLAGELPRGERRVRNHAGGLHTETVFAPDAASAQTASEVDRRGGALRAAGTSPRTPARGEAPVAIYAHAVSRDSLERVIRDLKINARVVAHPENAEMVVALRARAGDARLKRLLEATGLPLYTVKHNTTAQMRRLLQNVFHLLPGVEDEELREAVREVEHAIQRVLNEGVAVPLAPRPPGVRRWQHRLIARYHLEAESRGHGAQRHLVIYPK
jgi:stage III sporulation protein SpoIIIAA